MNTKSNGRGRILVVDDAADLRESVRGALEQHGYDVTAAGDAEGALASMREHPVDLVISDLMMRDGPTGLDLISRLRNDLAPSAPTIIACSGFHQLGKEAARRGAVFLPKPFEIDDLLMVVERTLDRKVPPPQLTARAASTTQKLRRQATIDAEEFLNSLGAGRETLRVRARAAAKWVADFLGVRTAAVVLVSDGALRVEASNDEARMPEGTALAEHVPLLRDVFESASSMILTGAAASAASIDGGQEFELICAVPVQAPSGLVVGALCLLDDRLIRPSSEDLEMLELLGRRASGALGATAARVSSIPLFEHPGILEAAAFSQVLNLTIRRASSQRSAIEVAVLSLSQGTSPQLDLIAPPERSAIGWLGSSRLALFVAAEASVAPARLAHALAILNSQLAITGAGVVGVHLDLVPPPSDHELLRLAGQIEHRARQTPGRLIRVVIKTEPWDVQRQSAGPSP